MLTRRNLVLALSTALGVSSLSAIPAAQAQGTTPTTSSLSALTRTDLAPGVLGAAAKSGRWIQSGANWYWWEAGSGYVRGWHIISGAWYYFYPGNAAMATGWVKVGGKWYYLDASGAMRTGWIMYDLDWYYLLPSGAMATSNVWINGELHEFGSDGTWLTGLPR